MTPFGVHYIQRGDIMEEKIKVSLPKQTLMLLKKDCEDFKILKDDGSCNMNAFVNTLIVNFYEEFSSFEEKLHNDIKDALFCVPEQYKSRALDGIIKAISKRNDFGEIKKESSTLSFKPTKQTYGTMAFIEAALIKNEAISSYYRRLFVQYSKKTKNEREKIIHKDNFQLLSKAIENGVQVCIVHKSGQVQNNLSPYLIASSRDELFNYLLSYCDKNNHTIRLANISSVTLLPSKATFSKKNIELFKRQIENGVQYPFYPSDDNIIKVELTEKGKKLFQKIYLYRPIPQKIEGDIYYFNCSANQALYYFERFGDSAIILSPKKLGIAMRDYHYYALKKYRTVYKNK